MRARGILRLSSGCQTTPSFRREGSFYAAFLANHDRYITLEVRRQIIRHCAKIGTVEGRPSQIIPKRAHCVEFERVPHSRWEDGGDEPYQPHHRANSRPRVERDRIDEHYEFNLTTEAFELVGQFPRKQTAVAETANPKRADRVRSQ